MEYNHDKIQEIIRVLRNPNDQLTEFLSKHKDDKEILDLYEEFRKYKEAGLKLEEINAPIVNWQWRKLNSKIQIKQRSMRMWIGAASFLLIASLGTLLTFEYFIGDTTQLAQEVKIEKGNAKAVLITSSGEEYKLEEGKTRTITDQNGVRIKADSNNVVQYSTDALAMSDPKLNAQYNTLKVPRLGEYQIVLSDGTKVWINSESELKYPVHFNQKERVVELTGEAYFEVKSDPNHPFVVKSNGINTRVLGTEFNVSAYPNEEVNITLVEGKVELKSGQNSEKVQLLPGENANMQLASSVIVVKKVDVRKFIAWRDGYFYFEKGRLEDILTKLERWYDFKVFYQNPAVKNYQFRMRADRSQEFSDIVSRLEQTGRVAIEINEKVIVVSDVSRE